MTHNHTSRHAKSGSSVGVLASLAVLAWIAPGCISLNLLSGLPGPLEESHVYGQGRDKILLLDVDGVISESPDSTGFSFVKQESTVARVREQLDRARAEGDIRALLVRINSPGGTASASDLVYRELVEFKRSQGIPVVAQLMGTATSGGYYVAMAADRVIANPTTVTGSIGVLFSGINVAGLMHKLGIEDQTLTSGKYKDAGSPLRAMTPVERDHIQSVLDDFHARFKAVVNQGRPKLSAEQVDALAEGAIYSADQALENGLVDAIGYLEQAVAEAERRAGLKDSRVITYHRSREWKRNLYTGSAIPEKLTLDWGAPFPELRSPGFHYLWLPGAL
jgi:protease-4